MLSDEQSIDKLTHNLLQLEARLKTINESRASLAIILAFLYTNKLIEKHKFDGCLTCLAQQEVDKYVV